MSLFSFPSVAFFSRTTFPCIPPRPGWAFLFALHFLHFHVSFFTPSFFSIFLSHLFSPSFPGSLLTGFAKWPSEAAGSPPGPLETCQAVICPSPLYPPLLAHLCFSSSTHFNLFFLYATIHLSSPSQPTSLLISSSHSSASLCLSASPLQLASFHLLLLFFPPNHSSIFLEHTVKNKTGISWS